MKSKRFRTQKNSLTSYRRDWSTFRTEELKLIIEKASVKLLPGNRRIKSTQVIFSISSFAFVLFYSFFSCSLEELKITSFSKGHNPEVLNLSHLTWKNGLPVGMHEIENINRMRKRRAWEKILPPMDSESNVKLRTKIVAALEADEWAFRESVIISNYQEILYNSSFFFHRRSNL